MKSAIKLEVFETLDTTLNIAREKLISSTNTDYAILALEQTNGVGQQGKKWLSPKGNFALSMVLSTYTFCDIGELALIFATSIYKTIMPLITEKASYNLKYKYPNDIYLYEKKLGGILVEVHQNRMIASVGLNLVYAPEGFISMKDYMREIPHDNISKWEIFNQNHNNTDNNSAKNNAAENFSHDSSITAKDMKNSIQDEESQKIDPIKIDPIKFFHLFWEQHQKDIESIQKEDVSNGMSKSMVNGMANGMDYVYNHWSKNLL